MAGNLRRRREKDGSKRNRVSHAVGQANDILSSTRGTKCSEKSGQPIKTPLKGRGKEAGKRTFLRVQTSLLGVSHFPFIQRGNSPTGIYFASLLRVVLSLRSFSRFDEIPKQEYNIPDGGESTADILERLLVEEAVARRLEVTTPMHLTPSLVWVSALNCCVY